MEAFFLVVELISSTMLSNQFSYKTVSREDMSFILMRFELIFNQQYSHCLHVIALFIMIIIIHSKALLLSPSPW